jgi:hypothetical protein
VLGDHQAKTNSIPIKVAFRIIQEPKKFEQFILVLFGYSDPSIFHSDLQELCLIFFNNADPYMNRSSLGKLESIGLQAEKHLHHPLLICIDHIGMGVRSCVLMVKVMRFTILIEVLKGGIQPDIIVLCLALLDKHHFLYRGDHIELFDIFSELARLEQGVVKQILYNK